jgi:hypothetical protein
MAKGIGSRSSTLGLASASALVLLGFAPGALAAPEWVDRGLTMHQLGLAFDLGVGVAHTDGAAGDTGVGLNLEGAFGILDNLEIGLRAGLRMGSGAKATQADQEGRLFDLETYGAGQDLFANPEIRVLGRVLDLSVVELGLEGRVALPFATGTRTSFVLGVPLRFHFGRIVRIDTGVYVPVVFYSVNGAPVADAASANLPVEVWFQVTRSFFLGPLAEIRINGDDPALGVDRGAGVLLGVGLGYQISRYADFKAAFAFPRVNGSPGPDFGAGAGLGLHFD